MTTRPDWTIAVLRCSNWWVVELGGHRYFELSKPLLSLSPPWRHPGSAGQM